jgi:hypothetical protein
MSRTVDCPHIDVGPADCPGCDVHPDNDAPYCHGEVSGHVFRDSDGDAGVINGVRYFVTVEDLTLSCRCTLSDAEQAQVEEALCELYDDDLADMDEDDARRGLDW